MPSADEWGNGICPYSGILNHKVSEVLTHATAFFKLESIMLNERKQNQRPQAARCYLYEIYRQTKVSKDQ